MSELGFYGLKPSMNLLVCLGLVFQLVSCGGWSDEKQKFAGRVLLEDETPLQGVEILYEWPESGGSRIEITDEEGWYEYSYGYSMCYEILRLTPLLQGYTFDPTHYEFPDVCDGDITDLNFIAFPVLE